MDFKTLILKAFGEVEAILQDEAVQRKADHEAIIISKARFKLDKDKAILDIYLSGELPTKRFWDILNLQAFHGNLWLTSQFAKRSERLNFKQFFQII